MRRKRTLGLAAMTLAPTLALTGACGATGSSQGKHVTIRVVTADYTKLKTATDVTKYWRNLADQFHRANPNITVEIVPIPVDEADAKVTQMVKEGDAPDLAQLDSYSEFAAKGELYPLDSLFPISMQSDFIPSLAVAGSLDRTQYGIPWVASTRMFFYNKKLFREAGIDAPPKTWDEMKTDAQKLKANGVQVPVGLPLGPQEAEAETMMWMLGDAGGYTDASGSYTFDSDANVDALRWIKSNLVDAHLVGPRDPAKTNVSDAFGDFIAGRTGMLNGHITLLWRARAAGVDVGVAQLPGRNGPSSQSLGQADWMMAFKQPDHVDADAKFVQYVYSQQNMLKFQDNGGLLPVTADATEVVWTNPKYRDLLPFMRLLSDAAFYPVSKTSWVPVSAELRKSIGRAVHGDPKAVLSDLQDYAQSTEQAEQKKNAHAGGDDG